jgi:hypothetical protein
MKQVVQKLFQNETLLSILLIFLVTMVTHGLRIPWLGYYHDDWYLLWSGAARGVESIIPLFSTDRPFMGVIYSYAYRLLGDNLLNWHYYALLWRFLGGLAFFWILRLIWPKQKYITTLMTVLFIVYPGFLSQPNANTKQNHLIGFASALFSIALMLQAIKIRSTAWKAACVALSALLTANYLFIYEYMIGFEGTRLALLGYALFQDGIRGWFALAKEMLKRWWPYPLVTAAFLYWRIFIFDSSRNATNVSRLAEDYLGNLRYMSLRLSIETFKDFLNTSVLAWFVKPYHSISGAEYSELGKAVFIALGVVFFVWLFSFVFRKYFGETYQEESLPALSRDLIFLGIFVVICAVFPVVLSGRGVELNDAYKSYGLHPISGVVLFVGGILVALQPRLRQATLLALLFISVTTQVLNQDRWEKFWKYERETWWQLTWRAPDIQDDTLLMVYFRDGYRLQQDYEIWGPANLIYRPGWADAPAIQAEVLTTETAYDIMRREVRSNFVRDIPITRDYNNLLLISLPTDNSCAHIIDGSLPVYSESDTLQIQQVGPYSQVDRIIPNGAFLTPPSAIFGAEPERSWCYYYQKASLARQIGNWEEIGRLYDEARAKNLKPGDRSEWIPFFEGLVNLGRDEDARKIVKQEIVGRERLRFPICQSLAKDPGYPTNYGYDYLTIRKLLCDT